MRKNNLLRENPLTPDTALRNIARGNKGGKTAQIGDAAAQKPLPAIRKTPSTTTPGGLLRKTVYFTETEWRAIRAKAYQEDRPYTDIVREAVRALLAIPGEE